MTAQQYDHGRMQSYRLSEVEAVQFNRLNGPFWFGIEEPFGDHPHRC